VTCPALVVVGEGDRLIPMAEARKLAAGLPHGRLVEIPGAGHLPNLENPEVFDEALSAFLDGLPA